MADKAVAPTADGIESYLGADPWRRLVSLEDYLVAHYQITKELRFPFGPSYGWGYKYAHKSAHLCYVFFERGAFTVTIQIGDKQVPALGPLLGGLSPRAQELWAHRYPCGERGGWVHYRVTDDSELSDIESFVAAKKKPTAGPALSAAVKGEVK